MRGPDLLKLLIGAILLVLIGGIVLSDYSTAMQLVIGASITLGIGVLSYLLGRKVLIIVPSLMIGVALFLFLQPVRLAMEGSVGGGGSANECSLGETHTEKILTSYLADVNVEDFSHEAFQVKEHIHYTQRNYVCAEQDFEGQKYLRWSLGSVQEGVEQDLPGRSIRGIDRGLFVHEVKIPKPTGYSCCGDNIQVRVQDLPYNAFYDAPYDSNLAREEYLGTETVTWQTTDWSDVIRFAYLPSPFHNMRMIVSPFIEFSKNDNWLLAGFGAAASWVLLLIGKPIVVGYLTDKVKTVLNKKDDAYQHKKKPVRHIHQ